MSQTSYSTEPVAALPGLKFDISPSRTRSAVVSSDAMFGVAVVYDSAGKVKLPAAATDEVGGILCMEFDHDPLALASKADGIGVLSGDPVSVMEEGKIYVITEEDVVENDPVYCRHTANGAGKLILGAFRKSSEAQVKFVRGARFEAASVTVKVGATDFKVAPISFDARACANPMAYQADSASGTAAGAEVSINALIAKLKAAGLMETA